MSVAALTTGDATLTLPALPDPPARAPFPVIASVAPVVVAVVLWFVMHSPYVLMFAALGPVIAVAGVIDGRRHARRRRRSDSAAYREALDQFERDVEKHHARERVTLRARTPPASEILSGTRLAERWKLSDPRSARLVLGSGTVRSSVRVSGATGGSGGRELHERAVLLDDAPVTALAIDGIGLVGPSSVAHSVARSLVVQLVHALSPLQLAVRAHEDGWEWLASLPHGAGDAATVLEIGARGASADRDAGAALRVVVADDVTRIPPECTVVLEVNGTGQMQVLAGPAELCGTSVTPELVTAAEAAAFAQELKRHALSMGLETQRSGLPEHVEYAGLPERSAADGLRATLGVTASAPLELDLVLSGPHAIVAGTTGSGKSELLITWVAAMAKGRRPDEVSFLLVDFKGGSAFAPLARLPHTVGVITDLGHGEAGRALQSLSAELRRRESVLAELGVRDIDGAGGALPRLVIVVDEFAGVLETFPELGALFVDIAARGRALGVHLIVCTQRATGVVREALAANCPLRISLRVGSRADSTAVVGDDSASTLPAGVPGRCVVLCDDERRIIQVATTTADDIVRIASGTEPVPVARPWLDPLPAVLTASALPRASKPSAVVIGIVDRPDRQARQAVEIAPGDDPLLVIGTHRSGKSVALRALGDRWAGDVIRVPSGLEESWDAVQYASGLLNGRSPERSCHSCPLVLIDDLDALLEMHDPEHADALERMLASLLRLGPGHGIQLACAAGRVTSALRGWLPLFGEPIVLRTANRQDHVLCGAPAELFDDEAPPGRGSLRGHRIQLAAPGEVAPAPGPGGHTRPAHRHGEDVFRPPLAVATAVVSRAPASTAELIRTGYDGAVDVIELATPRIGEHGAAIESNGDRGKPLLVVADPDTWNAHWSLLGRLRATSPVVFTACTPADVRALVRGRVLPPPLSPAQGRSWLVRPEGGIERTLLPAVAGDA
jgi:S-DNA-T family DNA segregation ATPase FtsK/SpoIIIE